MSPALPDLEVSHPDGAVSSSEVTADEAGNIASTTRSSMESGRLPRVVCSPGGHFGEGTFTDAVDLASHGASPPVPTILSAVSAPYPHRILAPCVVTVLAGTYDATPCRSGLRSRKNTGGSETHRFIQADPAAPRIRSSIRTTRVQRQTMSFRFYQLAIHHHQGLRHHRRPVRRHGITRWRYQLSSDVTIDSNLIYNNAIHDLGASTSAVSMSACQQHALVVNNLIRDKGRNGVAYLPAATPVYIVNNTIYRMVLTVLPGRRRAASSSTTWSSETDRQHADRRPHGLDSINSGAARQTTVLKNNIFYRNGVGDMRQRATGSTADGQWRLTQSRPGRPAVSVAAAARRESPAASSGDGLPDSRSTRRSSSATDFQPQATAALPRIDKGLNTYDGHGVFHGWAPRARFVAGRRPPAEVRRISVGTRLRRRDQPTRRSPSGPCRTRRSATRTSASAPPRPPAWP